MSERRRLLTRAILGAAALVCAVASPAAAADLCAEASRPGVERVDSTPLAITAHGVWKRVYGAVYGSTGRETNFAVLGPAAKLKSGQPFPPHAFICPARTGAPTVYVTHTLLEVARDSAVYGDDFLGLVIGHELGHRVADFDWQGRITTKSGGASVEARADARGAFFAAAAGYATRRLACDNALDLFLNVHAHVNVDARTERKQRMRDVLKTFDVYESLYDTAVSLTFYHTGKAIALLRWINAHLEKHVEPIAEFKLLQAQALVLEHAGASPFRSVTKVPGAAVAPLSCLPVFPRHTAFWDEPSGPSGSSTQRSGRLPGLDEAAKLASEARNLGVGELAALSTLGCAQLYQGDHDDAQASFRAAEDYAKNAPDEVKAALKHNATLVTIARWMASSKPADSSDWRKRFKTESRRWRSAAASIGGWLDRVAGKSVRTSSAFGCKGKPPRVRASGGGMLPPMPPRPRAGGCPCGWSELHRLAVDGDPEAGVVTCSPTGWATGVRYVEARLPDHGVDTVLMLVDTLDGALSEPAHWEHCDALVRVGVSDAGGSAVAGSCKALGAPQVVAFGGQCRVDRATIIGTLR